MHKIKREGKSGGTGYMKKQHQIFVETELEGEPELKKMEEFWIEEIYTILKEKMQSRAERKQFIENMKNVLKKQA